MKEIEKKAAEAKKAVETEVKKVETEAPKAVAKVKEAVKQAAAAVEKKVPKSEPKAKKAAEPKKTTAVSKNLKTKLVFQFNGNSVDADELLKKAQKAAAKKTDKQIKTLEVYVNGHENAAYYVVNGEGSDDYRIDL